ncbi:SPASM domain-containing protein [Streptomyces inusitatus]|uniref:SPASM domain-containing protein n=1 Tax=Streptomyces inusitatus TaxID=68221 RepID=UPI00167C8BAD
MRRASPRRSCNRSRRSPTCSGSSSTPPGVWRRGINVGNVREASLTAIWNGAEMATARTQIEQATNQACAAGPVCLPACGPCLP